MGFQSKVRVALVGDTSCGKTSIAVKFTQNIFIDYHSPTEYVEDFTAEIDTRKGLCSITVLDTSSSSDSEEVRSLAYECCSVVVICFDLTDRRTLESIKKKWLPELGEKRRSVPFIIAGCKRDQMCEEGPNGCVCGGRCCSLSDEELTALISRTGAEAYIECSAFADENVDAVFGMAAECALHPRRRKNAKRLVASIKKKLSRSRLQ